MYHQRTGGALYRLVRANALVGRVGDSLALEVSLFFRPCRCVLHFCDRAGEGLGRTGEIGLRPVSVRPLEVTWISAATVDVFRGEVALAPHLSTIALCGFTREAAPIQNRT